MRKICFGNQNVIIRLKNTKWNHMIPYVNRRLADSARMCLFTTFEVPIALSASTVHEGPNGKVLLPVHSLSGTT